MPSATKAKKPAEATQRAVVRSLSQNVAAELVGKPAYWLRDHADKVPRNPDDTYSGPDLVQWFLDDTPPAELEPELLEPVMQAVEWNEPYGQRWHQQLAAFEAVYERHGNAGLAAIGLAWLQELRRTCKLEPNRDTGELPSEEDYVGAAVAKAEEEARQEYAAVSVGWGPRQQGKVLFVCSRHKRYRLGRKWHPLPLPSGYAEHDLQGYCDKCRQGDPYTPTARFAE